MTTDPRASSSPTPVAPRRWVGPAVALLLVVIPVVILVASNTASDTLAWAGYEWEAPRWLVLAATFAAGAVGGKLFGWLWRSWRRRRRRFADEREVLRRHADGQEG